MSMLDVAKCLYFSKSIDLSRGEERFLNLSMVDSGHLFSCLNANRTHRDWLAEEEQEEPVVGKRPSLFWKGK
jgi:hypothetical protein